MPSQATWTRWSWRCQTAVGRGLRMQISRAFGLCFTKWRKRRLLTAHCVVMSVPVHRPVVMVLLPLTVHASICGFHHSVLYKGLVLVQVPLFVESYGVYPGADYFEIKPKPTPIYFHWTPPALTSSCKYSSLANVFPEKAPLSCQF